jgi:hypothetical protein
MLLMLLLGQQCARCRCRCTIGQRLQLLLVVHR